MFELIDNASAFLSSVFYGVLISAIFYAVFYFFTKDKHYVDRKYLVFVVCAAIFVSLLPQIKELLIETNPDDLLVVGLSGGGLREEPTNTIFASFIGKVVGCVVGFFGGNHFLRRFDF